MRDQMILARHKKDSDFVPVPATNRILRSFADEWLTTPFGTRFEKQYRLMKPMVLFEEYLEDLCIDINLFCFYGKVEVIRILFISDYKKKSVASFYDSEWNLIRLSAPYLLNVKNIAIDKPQWLDNLIAFTEQVTQNIDHVRADYFIVGNTIYFGEFTFTSGPKVIPAKLQASLGRCWVYPDQKESFGQVLMPAKGLIENDIDEQKVTNEDVDEPKLKIEDVKEEAEPEKLRRVRRPRTKIRPHRP